MDQPATDYPFTNQYALVSSESRRNPSGFWSDGLAESVRFASWELAARPCLELLDWVVDPTKQRLIGNPEHGGENARDAFCERESCPRRAMLDHRAEMHRG